MCVLYLLTIFNDGKLTYIVRGGCRDRLSVQGVPPGNRHQIGRVVQGGVCIAQQHNNPSRSGELF